MNVLASTAFHWLDGNVRFSNIYGQDHPVYDDHSGNVPRVVIKVVRGILEVSKES